MGLIMFRPIYFALLSATTLSAQVADPSKFPYADSSSGRPSSPAANNQINSERLYHFYSRQADHYRSLENVPPLLPAYPGLDGGKHGHWGKYNQNNHNDGRRNDIDTGTVVAGILESDGTKILKAVNTHLGTPPSLATAFDPQSLAYRSVWTPPTPDSFVHHPPFRWALSRGTLPQGET
ncbi:MAG: hypothetical protein P8J87_01470, partial [Verrucomicrobiales bacterium]|nr:hypothetical protein [Verrucomicrobiales bacterium]